MKYPINLNESSEVELKMNRSREHYPHLHLQWDKPYNLPDDGTMTVRFHKCSETNTEGDNGFKQSLELDILSIESVKADKEPPPKKSARDEAEEALDSYKDDVDDSAYQ